jgi:hypothetical protein
MGVAELIELAKPFDRRFRALPFVGRFCETPD